MRRPPEIICSVKFHVNKITTCLSRPTKIEQFCSLINSSLAVSHDYCCSGAGLLSLVAPPPAAFDKGQFSRVWSHWFLCWWCNYIARWTSLYIIYEFCCLGSTARENRWLRSRRYFHNYCTRIMKQARAPVYYFDCSRENDIYRVRRRSAGDKTKILTTMNRLIIVSLHPTAILPLFNL